LVPDYWTEVVILVNKKDPTPLSEVGAIFKRSKDLPIIVRVTRTDDRDADLEEGQRTKEIIELMKPHLRRCFSIIFDVLHGSSLPAPSRDLVGIGEDLSQLVLACQFDDGDPSWLSNADSEPIEDKDNPSVITLTELQLHGHTIPDFLEHNSRILVTSSDILVHFELANLDCRIYTERKGQILPEILQSMVTPMVETYTLNNIHLLPPSCDQEIDQTYTPITETFSIKNLGGDTVKLLMSHLSFSQDCEVRIEACSLSEISLKSIGHLHLVNIDDFLLPCLYAWQGVELQLSNCPGLTNLVLNALIGRNRLGTPRHELHDLTVIDCPNVSATALKRFTTYMSIDCVAVFGHPYNMPPEEQREVYDTMRKYGSRRVKAFSWNDRDMEDLA